MTFDLLISDQLLNRSWSWLIQCDSVDPFPCNLHLTLILVECLLPVIIPWFLVSNQVILNSIGHSDPQLVCCPPVLGLHIGYDYIPTPQYLGNPPIKFRPILYTICKRILHKLYRVWILDVFKLNPICGLIFPQYHYLLSYICDIIPLRSISIPDLSFLLWYHRPILPMFLYIYK